MAITTEIESNYICIKIDAESTMEDLREFQVNNVDLLRHSNILFDFTLFDFSNIDSEYIENYIMNIKDVTDICGVQKRALLVNSDIGFATFRVYKSKARDKLNVSYELFSDLKVAVQWLSEK